MVVDFINCNIKCVFVLNKFTNFMAFNAINVVESSSLHKILARKLVCKTLIEIVNLTFKCI